MNEETVRRIEAALEERKRQRRAAATKAQSPTVDRRGPRGGRRDNDHAPAGVAPTIPTSVA